MAETVAFRTFLTRIGLTDATRTAIENQGITNLAELAELDLDDIKNVIQNILKYVAPHAPAGDVITIPYATQKKLYAAQYWVQIQKRCGLPQGVALLTDAALAISLARKKEVDERKEATKDQKLTKPPKLAHFKDWMSWWELWDTYMQQSYGTADIPLSYIYREHDTITAEIRAAAYAEEDDRYIATTALAGRHFQLDNKRVWNELKPLVVDGPGWVFIKSLETSKHGRNALLTLKRQNEGENSTMIRKQKAYSAIRNLAFAGPKKHWSFSQYVTAHQKAHNELASCFEPVPETKKVTDFLGGITDPSLSAGLANVYGDTAKLVSFEDCQQYLSTIVASTNVHKRNQQQMRGVGALGGHDDGNKKPKLEARDYPLNQWKMFSPEEQKKIRQLRFKKKTNKKTRATEGRQASAAGKESLLPPLVEGEPKAPPGSPPALGPKGGQAGNQFGKAAHGKQGNNNQ
jgi:hypothetical protein